MVLFVAGRITQRCKEEKAQRRSSVFLCGRVLVSQIVQNNVERAYRRRGWCLIALLLSSLPIGIQAQTDSVEVDSLEVFYGPTVVLTASRITSRIAEGTHPTALITRERIEESGARDLSDAITFSPGLFVKRYGGLGGLRTVSLRGAASEGAALLIDGVRYRSSAEGGFDLGNIPAEALSEVEVVRGGDAALFGANSLGGAINIVTGEQSESLRLRGNVAAGSFGEKSVGLSGTGVIGGHSWDGSLYLTQSDGDYPFLFNEFGETQRVSRENGDLINLFARVGWRFQPSSSGWKVKVALQGYDTDRGVPGAVVQGNRERLEARLDENDLFGLAHLSRSFDKVVLSFATTGRLNQLRYSDPTDRTGGITGVDNHYDLANGSLSARGLWFVDGKSLVESRIEVEAISLNGDNLDPSLGDQVDRKRVGGLLRATRIIHGGSETKQLKIDGGIRLDAFSDLDLQVAPTLGLVWRPFTEPIRIRAHGALNYRAPSFNEQYYLNFGNAELEVERSRSVNVGGTWEASEGIVIESSLFLIDTRDRIIAIPRSPVSWSAQNIGRTLSRGVEFGLVGSLFKNALSGSLSYTLMKTEDRSDGITHGHVLPYSPQELFNGLITLKRWDISLTGSWEYVSHRHTLSFNTPESALPRYMIVNLGVARKFQFGKLETIGRLDLSNLFNESYHVVRNYPMPGRSFRFELSFGWKEVSDRDVY